MLNTYMISRMGAAAMLCSSEGVSAQTIYREADASGAAKP
jgi:hypothetical protein